jgi:hypothetical protein
MCQGHLFFKKKKKVKATLESKLKCTVRNTGRYYGITMDEMKLNCMEEVGSAS